MGFVGDGLGKMSYDPGECVSSLARDVDVPGRRTESCLCFLARDSLAVNEALDLEIRWLLEKLCFEKLCFADGSCLLLLNMIARRLVHQTVDVCILCRRKDVGMAANCKRWKTIFPRDQ